jgi:hypothetical protein
VLTSVFLASWYYADSIDADLIRMFVDVRWVGFLPPHFKGENWIGFLRPATTFVRSLYYCLPSTIPQFRVFSYNPSLLERRNATNKDIFIFIQSYFLMKF